MPDNTSTTRPAFPSRRFVEELLLRDYEIPIGIIMTDLEGTVTHWGGFASVLYGWSELDAIGSSIVDLNVGPLDVDAANQIMASLSKGEPWSGTFTTRRKDGSSLTVNVLDLPVLGDDGEIVGIVGFSREESEQFVESLTALDELRDLADRLDEVRQAEQQRIAAELHDHLSQPIAMMATEVLKVARECDRDADAVALERIGRTLQASLRTLQNICSSLRPPGLDEFGVHLALESLLESWSTGSGIAIDSFIDDDISLLDPQIAEVIVQVITEALANIERHAGATSARVTIEVDGYVCSVAVTDDGVGCTGAPGFGIRLMIERARRVGGRLEIGPRTDGAPGTRLALDLPVSMR